VIRVIAIDGPAASGKSSTGARVARRLGWAHLDSGALYRALTLAAIDRLGEAQDTWPASRILALAEELPVRLVLVGSAYRAAVAGVDVEEAIRGERVTRRVSMLAAIPEVRQWVNHQQRRLVAEHPAGVVVDGRDIGTVVFPDADLKVFLTASPEARAGRRINQRGMPAEPSRLEAEAAALAARDHADSTRVVAPLRAADDAVLIDTTSLSFGEQVDRIVELARPLFGRG
jgi:CMP/dCMP kinase